MQNTSYKMMKANASYQAPTVWDFPYDVLSTPMLAAADKNTVVNMVNLKIKCI